MVDVQNGCGFERLVLRPPLGVKDTLYPLACQNARMAIQLSRHSLFQMQSFHCLARSEQSGLPLFLGSLLVSKNFTPSMSAVRGCSAAMSVSWLESVSKTRYNWWSTDPVSANASCLVLA